MIGSLNDNAAFQSRKQAGLIGAGESFLPFAFNDRNALLVFGTLDYQLPVFHRQRARQTQPMQRGADQRLQPQNHESSSAKEREEERGHPRVGIACDSHQQTRHAKNHRHNDQQPPADKHNVAARFDIFSTQCVLEREIGDGEFIEFRRDLFDATAAIGTRVPQHDRFARDRLYAIGTAFDVAQLQPRPREVDLFAGALYCDHRRPDGRVVGYQNRTCVVQS